MTNHIYIQTMTVLKSRKRKRKTQEMIGLEFEALKHLREYPE